MRGLEKLVMHTFRGNVRYVDFTLRAVLRLGSIPRHPNIAKKGPFIDVRPKADAIYGL